MKAKQRYEQHKNVISTTNNATQGHQERRRSKKSKNRAAPVSRKLKLNYNFGEKSVKM